MQSKVAIFNQESSKFSIENEVVDTALGSEDVLIKQTKIAINDIDIVDGTMKNLKRLGYTAYGKVENLGADVEWLKIGDRVAYFTEIGSYCQYRVIKCEKLVKVPEQVSPNAATALLYRGCIAHMATARAFIIREGINVLIDNIHTATSAAIAWMAKQRGAFVIGITDNAEAVTPDICDVTVTKNDFTKQVLNVTNNIGCHVYYTSLETSDIKEIANSLTVSGVIVDHLNVIKEMQTDLIYAKSLFFTAPSIIDYKTIRSELVLTVDEVVTLMQERPLQLEFQEFQFENINEAFLTVKKTTSNKAVIINC